MKKNLLLILPAVILFSCSKDDSNKTDNSSCSVWADQISAQSPVIIQEGWSEADWNKENKFNREKIFNTILEAVLAGKLQAYDVYENKPISIPDIQKMIHRTDTLMQEDLDHPEAPMREIVVKTDLKAEDIARIDTKEKWLFDEKTYTLIKEVESITFLTNSYTEKGEIRGVAAVFMVKLNH
jgi:hypothetical protein